MQKSVTFLLLLALSLVSRTSAQTVEKVADLVFSSNSEGEGHGGFEPLDRFTQHGTNLWFTTAKGGVTGFGTISRFDLVTRDVIQVASLTEDTGTAPEGSLLIIGNSGYFTTTDNGTGGAGTIAKVDLETGTVTALFNFPADGSFGKSARGGLTRIGDYLCTTTSLGGSSSKGTIVRHNLTSGVTEIVTNLSNTIGGQPYDGFTQVGDAWYYTTLSGGTNTGPGYSNGAGTLSRLTFDSNGEPVVTTLLSLQSGYTQIAASAPVSVGSNFLYFTTVGPTTNPGAIVRFDIQTGTATNLFTFNTNIFSPVDIGRQPGYNGLTEWQGSLYFLTRLGGVSNVGIVAKFDLASNTLTKLADFTGNGANSLGSGSGSFNTGTVVEENGRFSIYYPVAKGGAHGRGTIIRVLLPPPPISSSLVAESNNVTLSWTGGYPPFAIEKTTNLQGGSWTTVQTNVTERFITIPSNGTAEFFRVTGSL